MAITYTAALGRMRAYVVFIVALAVLSPSSAQAQSGPPIVVTPFVSKTVAFEELCPEVSVSIAEHLSDELDIDVVVAGDNNQGEPQISITGRIFTLGNKPALMARITHLDSGRTFSAIVSIRADETLVEMGQRLAESIGATITARSEVLSVAPGDVRPR